MDGVDLTTPAPVAGRIGYQDVLSHQQRRRPRISAKLLCFLLVVVLPTALASTYYFGFAADQYVSEAKFVVRGPTQQSSGVLSSLLQTAGVSRAQDDTYAVQDYMLSRDALAELIKNDNLREIFDRPEADPLSRFPLWMRGDTFEHFYKFYQDHVEVTLDSNTGVSAITVRTFRADDSEHVATALLDAAERLVNRMNDRQRDNAMRDARKEIAVSEERVQVVAQQIAEFRNRESLLDPTKQSAPILQGIAELQTLLSRTELQLSQLKISAPNSPMISDLARRASAVTGQINELKSKITGSGNSMVPKITAYDMLTLQREFADRGLASAFASLETARIQAERQQLYLEQIVKPNLADYAAYPKRFVSIGVVFATFMGIYIMGSLLVSGAREHRIV